MTTMCPEGKHEMRCRIRKLRRCMDKEVIDAKSKQITAHLAQWPQFQSAKTIMMFLAMPDEPQMTEAIQLALSLGKTVCVPHMRETRGLMDAAIIRNLDDLIVGQFDLLVPNPATLSILEPEALDLIIVPGVAYDKTGCRLGMGAGYYDRFLPKAVKAELIGAAWSAQILDIVPTDPHDRPVKYLLTEDGIFSCCKGKM